MPVSHKCDLLKGVLFVLSCIFLQRSTDASRMYHSVRGQDTLKLYVIFNVLEVGELASFRTQSDLLAPVPTDRRPPVLLVWTRSIRLFVLQERARLSQRWVQAAFPTYRSVRLVFDLHQ